MKNIFSLKTADLDEGCFPKIVLFGVVFLQLIFVVWSVTYEQTFYFWDHGMYHAMAKNFFLAPIDMKELLFKASLKQDYPLFFALPSWFSFSVFGSSRLVFILTNFFVFFIPFQIGTAFILKRIFHLKPCPSLIASFLLVMAIPPLWTPLLEGYPDHAALALLILSIGLLMEKKRGLRKAFLIGFLFSMTVLLRRHFVYPVIALGLTSILFDLWRSGVLSWRLKKPCLAFLLTFWPCVGLAGVVTLYLIAPIFLWHAVSVDYTGLYASYKKPALDFIHFAGGRFGPMLLLLTLTGIILAWRRGVFFITMMTGFCLILWMVGPSQAGAHYLLHVLPLFMMVGLMGLFLKIQQEKHIVVTWGMPLLLLFLLIGNTLFALVFAEQRIKPNEGGEKNALSSAPSPPTIRKDRDILLEIGKALIKEAKPDDKIAVLGSSFVFNQDLMRVVLEAGLNNFNIGSSFLRLAEIDVKEEAPLNAITSATLYLVPTPTQYHLEPEGQKVVTAASSLFPPSKNLIPFFQKKAGPFLLEDGVSVDLWRRKAWSSEGLFEALIKMRTIAPSSKEWVLDIWAESQPVLVKKPAKKTVFDITSPSFLTFMLTSRAPSLSLFLGQPLFKNALYELSFDLKMAGRCLLENAEILTEGKNGKILRKDKLTETLVPGNYHYKIKEKENFFLKLSLDGKPVPNLYCRVTLDNLSLVSKLDIPPVK